MELRNMSNFYYNKGLQLIRNRDITGALIEFSKSLEFNIENYLCCNVLGLCFYKLGEFKAAKSIWEKSIAINNTEENLGKKYLNTMEERDFKEVCQKYNSALKFCYNKNYKKSVTILTEENLRKRMKGIVVFDNLYGLCNYGRGNKDMAAKAWRNVLEVDKNNKHALKYLSQIYKTDDNKNWFSNIFKKHF